MSRAVTAADEVVLVTPDGWRAAVTDATTAGFTFLHSIGAVDDLGRDDTITVTCRLLHLGAGESAGRQLRCVVPRTVGGATLPSVRDLLAGADWHEREVHDFFGVRFEDGDDRPLLHHDPLTRPLRKDVVLASRSASPWPGAKEPGEPGEPGASGASRTRPGGAPSRRRMAPVGVPDPGVWGDRPLGAPAPDAAELAAALAGGRVRRRR